MNNLFRDFLVYFDSEDKENGSLYIFAKPELESEAMAYINLLQESGLWTKAVLANVRNDQRAAYAEQLEQIELLTLQEGNLYAGRFNHSKFPSSADRWQQWLDCLCS